VARDQVKTQVLLLHSEQRTLDKLSSGLDDRYTVHCATSGTEALNTLGDTPIHIIVSAKDLPGMSGVEALREAKKRSPETIGILLAGENDRGLEALVGEKEVFQVVSGGISPAELTRLIENATRQVRLLALAESANDMAANPDDLAAEHIVMETSENGSTIITGGTGTVPALDPRRMGAAGAQAVDVLVLTKDDEFLNTVRESTRGLHEIYTAHTLAQAEDAIAKHKVGVAVVDAAMVGDNLEKLTQHLRKKTARLVNVVAGRRDDGEMLMDLINRGKVYRFLLKPVSPGRARLAIEASVKHHLEAPESAFKLSGQQAPSASVQRQASAKPAPRNAAARRARPTQEKAGRPAIPQSTGSSNAGPLDKLMDDGLGSAFDGDDSSFTETVTGLVANIGSAFKKKDKAPVPDAANPQAARHEIKPVREHAIARNLDSIDGGGSALFRSPKLLGVGAVLLLAVAAAGYWSFGGSDDPASGRSSASPTNNTAATRTQNTGNAVSKPRSLASADELLAEARLARDAGQVFNPTGGNAIELYAAAAEAAPGNKTIEGELTAVVDQALSMAEKAMLENRVDDADAALQRITMVDANNARLPFLSAQLAQIQLRRYLDDARNAIRESRFEDAGTALSAARALGVTDNAEITAVNAELTEARSSQRVEDVLARAADRLNQGQLVAPPNDNARYYYELVLSGDPKNAAALQGLIVIASKLVLQARGEIDAGRFDAAGQLLDDAKRLDSTSADLSGATQALADARARVAAESRRQEADRQAAAQRAENQRLAAELEEKERLAAEAAAAESEAENSDADPVAAEQTPLPVSSLNRLKYVAPRYPRMAERRNLSGWVDIVFTVATDGTTKNIDIRGAEPDDVFIESAITAIEKWEFEPIMEDGIAVERQAGVRMMFALE
jgi:serine/threonine-protein kinase